MSFPRYAKYKASGVEWLGEVPEHWDSKRLRFAVAMNPSKQEVASLDPDTRASFLPMEAIGEDGTLRLDVDRPLGEMLSGYTYMRDGDVVIAKITPCFENGKGGLIDGLLNGFGFGTTELINARPQPGQITGAFLNYLFRSPVFRRLGESHMYGAGGQQRVPDDFVRDFLAALPPVVEQERIAAFLDHETAKLDALVAEQQRLIELLKEKRQAVISHAVTKGLNPDAPMKPSGVEWLGEVPAHWEVAPLASRYSVQLGKMLDTDKIEGHQLRPYLRVADVQWGEINIDDLPMMDFDEAARVKFRLVAEDLLVNEGGSYPGRSAIWTDAIDECYYQKALHRVRAYRPTGESSAFLYSIMQWATNHGVFVAGGNEATIQHLPAEKLRRYRFAFPPVAEQQDIVRYLTSCLVC